MSESITNELADKDFNHLSQEQREWLKSRLNQHLVNRPPRKSLTDRNLIPLEDYSDRRTSDRDSLSLSLERRPDIGVLMKSGILERRHSLVSPRIASSVKELERNFRKDDLNQKLYSRVDSESLQKRGIMKKQTVAPSLQQNKARLEHAMTKDKLNLHMYRRPAREELIQRRILPSGDCSALVLQRKKALEQNMMKDTISYNLNSPNRKTHNELQKINILKNPQVASSLQATQQMLNKNLTKSNIYHALNKRPSLEEVIQKGYFQSYNMEEEDHLNNYIAPPKNMVDDKKSTVQPNHQQSQREYLQRRSKNFHLTRILLKSVASMAQAGKISLEQKGHLKDLIVDQYVTILAVAETFDSQNDLVDFEDSLIRLASGTIDPPPE